MRTLSYFGSTSRMSLGENGSLPSRVPLHPFGEFVGNGVSLRFDAGSLEQVKQQLAAKGVPFVLDLHHATVKVEEGEVSEAPAMGWIGELVVQEGFVYGNVEWTELGAQKLAGGAYGYVSPVLVYQEEDGQVVGYHSFALTNRPGTFNQRRIGLEAAQGGTMDWLKELLGLPATMTDDEVKAALQALLVQAALGDLLEDALELQDSTLTPELRGRIIALAANEGLAEEVRNLRAELEQGRTQREQDKVAGLVQTALEDGRILEPERARWERLAKLDLEGAKAALEALPRRVPTQLPTVDRQAAKMALEDTQAQANRLLGINAESFKKYGGN